MVKASSPNNWFPLTENAVVALSPTSFKPGISTEAVHGGRMENPYHSITEPLVSTATYTFENTQAVNEYMRQK